MKDTRLIKLLRTFRKEDLKYFEKFLQSPFLKPAINTIPFFQYIIKFMPEYDSPKLEKEAVFKKLYPGESYSEKKIQNLIFYLTQAAEDFLALNYILKDEMTLLFGLSKGYMEKNLLSESNRINKIIEKKLQPGFSQSKDYSSKFRQLNFLKSSFFAENNEYKNIIESKRNYFEASALQFIIDYTEMIASVSPAMNTYGINLKNEFIESIIRNFNLDNILSELEKSEYSNKHLILLHHYKTKTELDPDNELFYEMLRDVFYEMLPVLDREEKCYIFNHLATYCVRKFARKKEKFISEGLKVYKKMIENDAYSNSENDYMQVVICRNIILFCLASKDPKMFEFFIDKFHKFIHPDYREDLSNYSLANLFFMKKEFEKSLVSVSKINQEFFLFKSDLKSLMLKIYYELSYFEQAFSMIDSYKHFISKTTEVPDKFKKSLTNYLTYYLYLLKIKVRQSKENPSFYKSKIEKENEIDSKVWLMEKADELCG